MGNQYRYDIPVPIARYLDDSFKGQVMNRFAEVLYGSIYGKRLPPN